MPLYYHPNHKSSEHYPTSESPPLTNLNHIEPQLRSHLSTILVTNYYIQPSFPLSLFSVSQSVCLSLPLSLSVSYNYHTYFSDKSIFSIFQFAMATRAYLLHCRRAWTSGWIQRPGRSDTEWTGWRYGPHPLVALTQITRCTRRTRC